MSEKIKMKEVEFTFTFVGEGSDLDVAFEAGIEGLHKYINNSENWKNTIIREWEEEDE